MRTVTIAFTAALVLGASADGASAHIVFAEPTAVAGAHWAGALRVSHGCDGSATTSVRVEIPAAITVARPRALSGWTVVIEHSPLATPVPAEGGGMLTERVSAVTWTGRLPDEAFEEFGLAAKLPAAPGPLAFPVIQTCEKGVVHWSEVAGADGSRSAHPAAVLDVRAGEHEH
jgi:uncharacterized protein YcnI